MMQMAPQYGYDQYSQQEYMAAANSNNGPQYIYQQQMYGQQKQQ